MNMSKGMIVFCFSMLLASALLVIDTNAVRENSYVAVQRDSKPAYKNEPANDYTRGCSHIHRCRGGH